MKKENILNDFTHATKTLLDMARKVSFNNISDKCLFIISEVKPSDKNFFEQTKTRIKENKNKKPTALVDILPEFEKLYHKIFEVNLYIYKVRKAITIIEVQYHARATFGIGNGGASNSEEPMLHCKVSYPSYYLDTIEKFDINWHFETLNHKWKMFWWQRKTKKYLESREVKL